MRNFVDLQFQYEWRGPTMQNIKILVCRECLDIPQENIRAITLPADPVPIVNARVQDFVAASTDYRAVSRPTVIDPLTGIPIPPTDLRVTQDCENRTLVPYGNPTGLDANAIMPLNGTVHLGVQLPVLSVFSFGTLVTVTCSAVHGLHNRDVVAVEGLTNGNGFFSVKVPTATTFTYETIGPVAPQLTGNTRIVTALVGLPRGFQVFPLTTSDNPQFHFTVPNPPTNVMASVTAGTTGYFLLTEDGTAFFVLEDGTTFIEQESGPSTGVFFLSEDGTQFFVLENGTTFLSQETAGPQNQYMFTSENGVDLFVLQDGTTYLEQEVGP